MTEPTTPTPPPARPGRSRVISVTAAVIVAVVAGVYGIGHLRSNPATTAACEPAVATASRLAPLAHGEVAALAVTRTPFRVPDLSFRDSQGRKRALGEWRGRTVLLNLWATWCSPCRREMPALDALEARLGSPKFEVVAINIDTGNPGKPRAFLKDIGVKHLAYYSDPTAQTFQDLKLVGKAFGMPTTLIVDRSGCEIGQMAGPAEWASDDGIKLVSAAVHSSD